MYRHNSFYTMTYSNLHPEFVYQNVRRIETAAACIRVLKKFFFFNCYTFRSNDAGMSSIKYCSVISAHRKVTDLILTAEEKRFSFSFKGLFAL